MLDDLKAQGEEQPLFKQIRQEGIKRERPLLLETLKALADGRLKVSGAAALDAQGARSPGILLNAEVDRYLAEEAS